MAFKQQAMWLDTSEVLFITLVTEVFLESREGGEKRKKKAANTTLRLVLPLRGSFMSQENPLGPGFCFINQVSPSIEGLLLISITQLVD